MKITPFGCRAVPDSLNAIFGYSHLFGFPVVDNVCSTTFVLGADLASLNSTHGLLVDGKLSALSMSFCMRLMAIRTDVLQGQWERCVETVICGLVLAHFQRRAHGAGLVPSDRSCLSRRQPSF